ncbi:hypothetical protein CBS101457_001546 [Exobasidium rhododendri]|nr:hypothetical protein CBS101457_001546 [Exobasidium rhododendri]
MPTFSRRSSRHSLARDSKPVTQGNSSRRSDRRNNVEEEEEEEEESGRSSKRRRHQATSGGNSRSRHRDSSPEEEEEAEGHVEEDEEEEEEEALEADEEDEEEAGGGVDAGLWGLHTVEIKKIKVTQTARNAMQQMGKEDVKRKANDLARLALFCELNRVTLKREDIRKKILDDKYSSKAFPIIFNRAQKVLAFTFGYEMVELRARGTDNEQIASAVQSQRAQVEGEQDEDGQVRAGTLSKTYIIRSLLPAKLIAKMAAPNSSLQAIVSDDKETVNGKAFDAKGVMLDWHRSGSELGSMGLLFFILSIILLNGRSIPDDLLRSYLRRMSLDPHKTLPAALQSDSSKDATEGGTTLDDFLQTSIKQSYLECTKVGAGGQGAMSMDPSGNATKRVQVKGRKTRGGGGGGGGGDENDKSTEDFEWRWGARAESEITEKAVAEFVAEIYLVSEEQGNGESQSSRAKKQENLIKHIENAAGSQLIA